MLAENKGGASSSATLLRVGIGEKRAFFRDAINVRRLITHHAVVVGADVGPADVITPNDENVRSLACSARARRQRVRRRLCYASTGEQRSTRHDGRRRD